MESQSNCKIVKFPDRTRPKAEMVLGCGCGCQLFMLHESGNVQCMECDMFVNAKWKLDAPDTPPHVA